MTALNAIIGTVIALWIMWGLYVLIVGVYRAKLAGRLNKYVIVLALPYVVVGGALDCALNLTVFSVLLLERPRELMVSQRLKRLMNTGSGWRQRIARAVCTKLLDVFDPSGAHCQ